MQGEIRGRGQTRTEPELLEIESNKCLLHFSFPSSQGHGQGSQLETQLVGQEGHLRTLRTVSSQWFAWGLYWQLQTIWEVPERQRSWGSLSGHYQEITRHRHQSYPQHQPSLWRKGDFSLGGAERRWHTQCQRPCMGQGQGSWSYQLQWLRSWWPRLRE